MSERLYRALALLAICGLAAGCVSTTTGAIPPATDEADAAEVNFQLAVRYFNNGKYELARDRLLHSIELNPRRGIVWSTLATTYEQLHNLRLAEESHNKAIGLAPRDFDVRNAYAVFLCRQQRFDDAEQQFDRSIRSVGNDNPEVMLTNAGVCMMQKPDYAKAEDYFRQALERRPNHGEALLQMSLLKHATNDDLRARAFLQRYRSNYSSNSGVLYLCVLIEEELGDDRARTECANELLRDFPDSQESRRLLESG
ncbi:MAG: type IV pilus biogenesis/stability protein PilW [Woeseiaceae bacterium]|nr:type IV pilus biogenesis/stability protein PilW [Woeseiaceae bacterium]